MRAYWLPLFLAVQGLPVVADTCYDRPTIVERSGDIAAADDVFVVLYGQFIFDEDLLPPDPMPNPPQNFDPFPGSFAGKRLTTTGFDADLNLDLTIKPTCAGTWCGSLSSGVDAVVFMRADPISAVFEVSHCSRDVFEMPTLAELDHLASCVNRPGLCPVSD